jgi:hypothetical protein
MKGEAFAAYSDESGIFSHRYQTIAVVSGPETRLAQLRSNLQGILSQNQINEVKFALIRTHRALIEAARAFSRCMVEISASMTAVRADIVTWDMQDSRHAIQGRNSLANLERMYYKVLTHAARQWNQVEWGFHPDTNSQVHWYEIAEVLNRTRLAKPVANAPLLFDSEHPDQFIEFTSVEPLDSLGEPLIQLADLLAGMARFMREEGHQCIQWLDSWGNRDQLALPHFLHAKCALDETIRTKQNRFLLIREFSAHCKRYRLGVSLRDRRCLWTPNPANAINFWNYEPQHDYDKAPKRMD